MPSLNNNQGGDAYHGQLAYGLIPVNLIVELLRPTTYVLGLLLPLLIGYFVYPILVAYFHVSQPTLRLTSESSVEAEVAIDTGFDVWRTITRNNLLSVLWSQTKEMTKPVIIEIQAPHTFHSAIGMFFSTYSTYFAGLVCVALCGLVLFAGMWVQQRIMLDLDANRHAILHQSDRPARSPSRARSRLNDVQGAQALTVMSTSTSYSTSSSSPPVIHSPSSSPDEMPSMGDNLDHTTVVDQKELFRNTPEIYAFVGTQGSGKSYAMKSFLFQLKDFFKSGLVITGSKHNHDFAGLVPDDKIWDGWDVENFTIWYEKYKDHQSRQRELQDAGKPFKLIPPHFILFDDLKGQLDSIKEASIFQQFIANFRHINVWVFFGVQTIIKGTPGSIQTSANYAFLFDCGPGRKVNTSLYEAFGCAEFMKNGALKSWEQKEFTFHHSTARLKERHCLMMIRHKGELPHFTAGPFPQEGFAMSFYRRPAPALAPALAPAPAPAPV